MAQIPVNIVKTETKQTTINGINYRYYRYYVDIDFVESGATALKFNTLPIANSVLTGYDTLNSGSVLNTPITETPSTINGSSTYRGPFLSGLNIVGDGFSGGTAYNFYRVTFIFIVTDINEKNLLILFIGSGEYLTSVQAAYSSPTTESYGYVEALLNNVGISHFPAVDKSNFDVADWWLANSTDIVTNNDPYSPGSESGTGGGTGSFDGTGDDIDIPSLPTLSAVDTGFITLFNPSLAQLKQLSSYMWDGSLFDLNTWQKLFADPMDAILGLSIVPVAVPNGGMGEVKVGNISTGISMTRATSQYVEVDCGTINVNEYWGAYLDYDPYTKAEIYLPYCGIHPIATDDIMGKPVHVVYHVDILSGACCAYVKCGGSVLYSFIGQCTSSIPISGTDFTNVINGVISAAVSVGAMAATGGATAPLVAPKLAQTAINSTKPSIEKSGGMSGTGGMMAVQTPYLILTRPRQALPARQNTFTGYPSFITENLGDLSGYTEIEEIHLENISATDSELSEIENLLKSGVIF